MNINIPVWISISPFIGTHKPIFRRSAPVRYAEPEQLIKVLAIINYKMAKVKKFVSRIVLTDKYLCINNLVFRRKPSFFKKLGF